MALIVDAPISPATTPRKLASGKEDGRAKIIEENEQLRTLDRNHHLASNPSRASPHINGTRPASHRRGLTTGVIHLPTSPVASSQSPHPRPSTSPSPTRPARPSFPTQASSYFRPQSAASGAEPRSPANKRPPASRSSHGIETSTGPPPALSTQRALSADTVWRLSDSIDATIQQPQLTYEALASLNSFKSDESSTSSISDTSNRAHEDLHTSSLNVADEEEQSTGAVEDKMITKESERDYDPASIYGDRDLTVRSVPRQSADTTGKQAVESTRKRENGDSHSSHEDLFLNIAQSDVGSEIAEDSISRRERRRSRLGLPAQRYSVPLPNSQLPTMKRSNGHVPDESSTPTNSEDQANPEQNHNEFQRFLSRDRSLASSVHPLDQRFKSRYSSIAPRASPTASQAISSHTPSPESQMGYGRRQSIPDTSFGYPSRGYKGSNLSFTSPGQYQSSPLTGPPSSANDRETSLSRRRPEGSESTVSTTAPSTVWDELDDLKSRIRKLELTGKLPTSSGAAISTATGERPQTGTTTVTTMSSSPKRLRVTSASPEGLALGEQELASMHPLLHSALFKSKQVINPNVYKALEATASDALILAAMTGNGGQGSSQRTPSVAGTSSAIDRQLKRKADSMCRSLTELCLAMSEYSSERESSLSTTRPESRNSTNHQQYSERSLDNSKRRDSTHGLESRSASRVMSRLEARRSSMFGFNGANGVEHENQNAKESDQEPPTPRPTKAATPTPLSRSSTALVRSRRTAFDDGERTVRPLSRSMTDSNRANPPRQVGNREYTSQHPLPPSDQRSPSVQSSLPIRRSYFSAEPAPPATPDSMPRGRRYLDRSTPSSADSIHISEARQQRLASLSAYTTTGRQRAPSFGRKLRQSGGGLLGRDTSVEL